MTWLSKSDSVLACCFFFNNKNIYTRRIGRCYKARASLASQRAVRETFTGTPLPLTVRCFTGPGTCQLILSQNIAVLPKWSPCLSMSLKSLTYFLHGFRFRPNSFSLFQSSDFRICLLDCTVLGVLTNVCTRGITTTVKTGTFQHLEKVPCAPF